jgi:hypothetical protein
MGRFGRLPSNLISANNNDRVNTTHQRNIVKEKVYLDSCYTIVDVYSLGDSPGPSHTPKYHNCK